MHATAPQRRARRDRAQQVAAPAARARRRTSRGTAPACRRGASACTISRVSRSSAYASAAASSPPVDGDRCRAAAIERRRAASRARRASLAASSASSSASAFLCVPCGRSVPPASRASAASIAQVDLRRRRADRRTPSPRRAGAAAPPRRAAGPRRRSPGATRRSRRLARRACATETPTAKSAPDGGDVHDGSFFAVSRDLRRIAERSIAGSAELASLAAEHALPPRRLLRRGDVGCVAE